MGDDALPVKLDLYSPSVGVEVPGADLLAVTAAGDSMRDTSVVCCVCVAGAGSSIGGPVVSESAEGYVPWTHVDFVDSPEYSDEPGACAMNRPCVAGLELGSEAFNCASDWCGSAGSGLRSSYVRLGGFMP